MWSCALYSSPYRQMNYKQPFITVISQNTALTVFFKWCKVGKEVDSVGKEFHRVGPRIKTENCLIWVR